ncbi:IS66 family insertion sequence hypothetical protein, partial [Shigella boydii]
MSNNEFHQRRLSATPRGLRDPHKITANKPAPYF